MMPCSPSKRPTMDSLIETDLVVQEVDCLRVLAMLRARQEAVARSHRLFKLYSLLLRYSHTGQTKGDLKRDALRWLQQAGTGGDVEALIYLVELYTPIAEREAQLRLRRYLRSLAELRSTPEDFFAIASHLIEAPELRRNYREAVPWLRRAIDSGLPEAHLALSKLYRQGLGVTRNPELAFRHLHQAAEGGLVEAELALARSYAQQGLFAPHNLVEEWLLRAVDHGSIEAMYALANEWYRQDDDVRTPRVLELWQRAADEGHPMACLQWGRWALSPSNPQGDLSTGIHYLCLAAQMGVVQARQELYQRNYDECGCYTGNLRGHHGESVAQPSLF